MGLRPDASGVSSGNYLCDEYSQPVLIDPAIYFGHRSMDLAMTTLFGGFEPAFYDAEDLPSRVFGNIPVPGNPSNDGPSAKTPVAFFDYHFPFPPNYREQWEIANLYPLLVHLNLFGKSYQGNILHTIQRF